TNSFNTFASVKKTVALTAGQHVLRLAFDANAANGYAAGLDWVKVTAVQQPPQSQSLVVSASALTVKEAGEARFSVNLSTAPASDVTVTVSRNAGGDPDLAVEKATLVFTPSNWNVAQQVVITAGADPDTADGSATFTIASSGLSSKTLVATEDDDDTTRQPGTYYVNLNGNDANAGTAPDHAWQSIAKINSMIFIPGDKILFRGEQSFNGSIFFNSSDSGTNASGALIAPITLGSYGTGNATISSGSSAGFFAQNNGGITLQNLNFRGAGLGTNTSDGIAFFNNAAGDVKQSGITVRGVTVSGYGKNGLGLGGFNGASGYRNVQITGSRFSENRDGVTVYGPAFNDAAPVYVNQTLRVANVLAYNNHGTSGVTNPTGNGIVFGSVAGGVIERSVAHHNGANNSSRTGPVGIWAYNADRITIQHNESYSNRRGTGGDGDGFDFDQNVSNSLMQYNYAHDNDGAGYLIYTGKANNLHDDNVVRYNVSERDGRMSGYGGVVIGGRVTDLEIYNNTIYFPSGGFGNNGAAVFITSIGDRIHVRNNILFTTGGARLINTPETVNELLFQRNSYWPGGGATAIGWGDVVYSSVSDWLRAKTAQERVDLDHNGSLDLAALTIDPGLTSPGNGGTIGDANNLAQLSAYKLRSGSGLRDVGLDLRARYGLHPGDQDFFGTTLMQGPGFDVGADEF
ncbi:MAG TPA: right-handed parallel beta-helix repeat-containing protein, partial [Tepidisphaeraceae bacterium]|nr:right-handed parallel beta-helix repeat-containing protein [Tepidisphaeraceae bacterium]